MTVPASASVPANASVIARELGSALPRSYLYVPADQPDRLAKAAGRGADALIADLEDAVAPSAKAAARATVRDWLSARAQEPTAPPAWLRVNAEQADLDIAQAVGRGLAGVVVPKAEPALLGEVDALLTARERELGLPHGTFGIQPLIETAAGLLTAAAVAAAPRVVRLGMGEVDLAAELGLRPGADGHELAALRLQVVVASAAAGIAAPVAPVSPDFRDLAALRDSTQALFRLGFRARTAIHPAQVPVINEVFTPAPAEVRRARRLVAAFHQSEQTGLGVLLDDRGRMVDLAVVRSARDTLARATPARGASQAPQVTVLGSLNMDITVPASRLPAPGMTTLGSAAVFAPGGKGANQAVAAARLGADVRMVGAVGDDDFGRQLLAGLRAEGVAADDVRVTAGHPTGIAMITVDPAGENQITVAPGANGTLSEQDAVDAAADGADVLVISAEIPVPVIAAALGAGTAGSTAGFEAGDDTPCRILNLAPVPPGADPTALLAVARPDWLVVNESEAAAILGRPADSLDAVAAAAAELADLIAGHAVVTVGSRGAVLAGSGGPPVTIPGFAVRAVDSVGAGDTFVGALAVALARRVPAPDAVRAAAAAAATAVTGHGAQAAMPRPADVLAATGVQWPEPTAAEALR